MAMGVFGVRVGMLKEKDMKKKIIYTILIIFALLMAYAHGYETGWEARQDKYLDSRQEHYESKQFKQ